MPTDYERDCPKCGDTTTVQTDESLAAWSHESPLRVCDNDACNWQVIISEGPTYGTM